MPYLDILNNLVADDMDSLIQLTQDLSPYHPAIAALAVLALSVLLQAFLTAPLAFASGAQEPGRPLTGDHTQLSFRAVRTHGNSVESLPPFGFALLAAIALGVGATFVNWCAIIHVVFRLLFWAVYYSGVGKVAGGPRTIAFIGGLLSNIALAGGAVWAFIAA